eukprot:3393288-Prymnesium_polylepis.1
MAAAVAPPAKTAADPAGAGRWREDARAPRADAAPRSYRRPSRRRPRRSIASSRPMGASCLVLAPRAKASAATPLNR